MKKTFLLMIIIIFCFCNAFSQLNKKTWLVGGNGGFSTINNYDNSNVKTSKSVYINLSSNIGYFVIDKLSAGVKLRYAFQKSDYTGNPNSNSLTQYGAGPFIRYYFLNKENSSNIFAEVNYLYLIDKVSNSASTSSNNTFGIMAGPSIFLNNVVGVEFTVGYSIAKYHPADSKSIFLQFGVGLQIHLETIKN